MHTKFYLLFRFHIGVVCLTIVLLQKLSQPSWTIVYNKINYNPHITHHVLKSFSPIMISLWNVSSPSARLLELIHFNWSQQIFELKTEIQFNSREMWFNSGCDVIFHFSISSYGLSGRPPMYVDADFGRYVFSSSILAFELVNGQ